MMRTLLLLLSTCFIAVLPARGQDRDAVSSRIAAPPVGHADLLAAMVTGCLDAPLSGLPSDSSAVTLGWSGPLSFLQVPVSAELLGRGRVLGGPDAAALNVRMEQGSIVYTRAGRGHVRRTADVALQVTLTLPDGRVTAADSCRDTAADELSRRDARSLADSRYDVTAPALPPAGLWRRYAEPAVLVAATAVGTYLFFNLRSRRTDGG